jgi:hypothetical protein
MAIVVLSIAVVHAERMSARSKTALIHISAPAR